MIKISRRKGYIKHPNEYIQMDGYTVLRITSDTHGIFDYILDDEDVYKTKQYHWGITRIHNKYNTSEFFYGQTGDKSLPQTKRMLHRFINDTPKGLITDHIDGNTLNTRKENLRTCTYKDNGKNKIMPVTNKSGVKGVYWDYHLKTPKWKAFIKENDVYYHLGYFVDFDDAVKARRDAEIRIQGEFSRDFGDVAI